MLMVFAQFVIIPLMHYIAYFDMQVNTEQDAMTTISEGKMNTRKRNGKRPVGKFCYRQLLAPQVTYFSIIWNAFKEHE